jgi:hypothetical protein
VLLYKVQAEEVKDRLVWGKRSNIVVVMRPSVNSEGQIMNKMTQGMVLVINLANKKMTMEVGRATER